MIALFAIVIFSFLIAGNLLRAHQAEASNAYEEVVYYKSIRIVEDDTLWSIADTYMGDQFQDKESYIEEVKRINHLNDDVIHSGCYLMIPYTETVSK
jgi:hypothetical protein